jgi:hypothetical protein
LARERRSQRSEESEDKQRDAGDDKPPDGHLVKRWTCPLDVVRRRRSRRCGCRCRCRSDVVVSRHGWREICHNEPFLRTNRGQSVSPQQRTYCQSRSSPGISGIRGSGDRLRDPEASSNTWMKRTWQHRLAAGTSSSKLDCCPRKEPQ